MTISLTSAPSPSNDALADRRNVSQVRMNNTEWMTFSETTVFLRKTTRPQEKMISILHERESYIENLLEGLILVPRRTVASELQHEAFSFVPDDYKRRLVKFKNPQFLGLPLRRFASLKCDSSDHYSDSSHETAAERREPACSYERVSTTTLRADILDAYCGHHRLIPLWITHSFRYSERRLQEFNIPAGRTPFAGATFCYFQLFGDNDGGSRPKMRSFSFICGKRLLNPAAV